MDILDICSVAVSQSNHRRCSVATRSGGVVLESTIQVFNCFQFWETMNAIGEVFAWVFPLGLVLLWPWSSLQMWYRTFVLYHLTITHCRLKPLSSCIPNAVVSWSKVCGMLFKTMSICKFAPAFDRLANISSVRNNRSHVTVFIVFTPPRKVSSGLTPWLLAIVVLTASLVAL